MILIRGAGGKTGGTLIKALFERIPAFSPSDAYIVTDLTQRVVIDLPTGCFARGRLGNGLFLSPLERAL
jgi:hypothetical protein